MYERFSDRARKAMQLANQEAQQLNHEYIDTAHILLGLIKEGGGIAANVLKNLNVGLEQIRQELVKVIQPGSPAVTMGKLPQTPRAKKVIEYSIEEAGNLNHNYVGTEHLLLGLLRVGESLAAQVLMNVGVKPEDVREEVLALLGHRVANQPQESNFPTKDDIAWAFAGAWTWGTSIIEGGNLTVSGSYPFGDLIKVLRQDERDRCVGVLQALMVELFGTEIPVGADSAPAFALNKAITRIKEMK